MTSQQGRMIQMTEDIDPTVVEQAIGLVGGSLEYDWVSGVRLGLRGTTGSPGYDWVSGVRGGSPGYDWVSGVRLGTRGYPIYPGLRV